MLITLLESLLPEGILSDFKVTDVQKNSTFLEIYLEEKHDTSWFEGNAKLYSNGFHKSITLKDFPLRDRSVLLHVRRRRWIDTSTNIEVKRDFSLAANGTRMTQEFASFLKGIS